MNRPVQQVSWKAVFEVIAIPILVAAVLSPVMYLSSQRDQRETVYPINLTPGLAVHTGHRPLSACGLFPLVMVLRWPRKPCTRKETI